MQKPNVSPVSQVRRSSQFVSPGTAAPRSSAPSLEKLRKRYIRLSIAYV
ncbi:MAG: hypothetical protein RBJ76_08445 [Stenomitos frigidus ULC029]